jgi:hypothetical protein
MALSATVLSAAMRAKLLAAPDVSAVDDEGLTAMCDALAEAVVEHVTAAAVVLPVLLVAPPGGGPVTGTGSVT